MVGLSLLLVTTLAVGAQAPAAAGPDPAALFKEAVRLHEGGRCDQAVEAYRQFLEGQPRNIEAWSNLGVCYSTLGRFDDAIAAYQKALEFSYLNASVRMNLALAYYKSARCPQAIQEFDQVLGSNPGMPNVLMLKADCLMQLGEYGEAVTLLRPLEPAMQKERVFNYLYGMALLQDNQRDAGLTQIDRILKDGDSAEAHLMMGLSQRTIGDFAAARDEFKRAVDRNPDLPLAHSLYGQMLMTTGDREGARQAFARELQANPTDFESNLYTGVILKEEQRLEDARGFFERALRARPGDPGVRYQLATIHLALMENEQALAILEPLVKETPAFIEARVSLATVYYRLKRKQEGDLQREEVARLTAEAQARQPGAQPQQPAAGTPAPAGTVPPPAAPPQ